MTFSIISCRPDAFGSASPFLSMYASNSSNFAFPQAASTSENERRRFACREGVGQFMIFADGYETLQVEQKIPAPWYEWVGMDFVTENLVPWTIRDRRVFQFHLEPRRMVFATRQAHELARTFAR